MLLRMQKALRSKSAAQKRQVWEEQLEEKRQKLQRESDTQSGTYKRTNQRTSDTLSEGKYYTVVYKQRKFDTYKLYAVQTTLLFVSARDLELIVFVICKLFFAIAWLI